MGKGYNVRYKSALFAHSDNVPEAGFASVRVKDQSGKCTSYLSKVTRESVCHHENLSGESKAGVNDGSPRKD